MKYSCTFLLWVCLLQPMMAQTNDFMEVIASATSINLRHSLENYALKGVENQVDIPSSFSPDTLISVAKSYLGTPHVMGGLSNKGIDCSGLIYISMKRTGINLPRSSHEQARYGEVIPLMDSLKAGDLVFFQQSYSSKNLITHTGIYLGNGTFIHTSASKGVEIIPLQRTNYWSSKFLFGTRFLEKDVIETDDKK